MSTTTTMTAEQELTLAKFDKTLKVLVNDGVVTAELGLSSKGNPLYRASVLAPLTSPDSHSEILERVTVVYAGQEILQAGRGTYVSEQRRHAAKKKDGSPNPKAGELIPNTGGNWTVVHSNMVDIKGESFQLQARVTIVDKGDEKGPRVRINVDCFKRAVNAGVTIGSVEGVTF